MRATIPIRFSERFPVSDGGILSAVGTAARIRDGALTCVAAVEAALARVERTEAALRAWVVVDRDRAMAAARDADRVPAHQRGRLHGVPVGIKDIFDVANLPTAAGFGPFADQIATQDSTVVARLRAAGAIILGKTVTTQFAYMDPPPTRNPWSALHTPGGSSSGSGAAVGARVVPVAIGSQTGGSVLRPAAYCGVGGVKPTFGRVSRAGVLPLAWSLDHPGVIARTVADAAVTLQVIAGYDERDPASSRHPVGDLLGPTRSNKAPRFVILDDVVERATDGARRSFERSVGVLADAGATVVRRRFPSGADVAISTHAVVMQAETAAVHRQTIADHPEAYAPRIRAYVETGMLIPAADYILAQRARARLRREAATLLTEGDCLLLPTVSGPAPGTDVTGDPTFQGIFSLLGLPAITVPSALVERLPVGLQIVAAAFDEAGMFGVAAWCENALPSIGAPPLVA
ncbi:MAG: amidase [Chloroflexota bacterium]|nr:MAG: amidase [Chloroflexota bacterium]